MNQPLRQRDPRQEEPLFLAFVRRKPCCVCTAPPRSHAAHVRMADLTRGKETTGMLQKPHDRWAVPLCAGCHLNDQDAQHKGSERAFWKRVGVDPFLIAETLWAQFCRRQARSPEQKQAISARARRILRKRKPMMEPGVEVEFVMNDKTRDLRAPKRSRDPEFYAYRWGKGQKIRSAASWPPKGSRKLQGRGFQ